MSLSDRVYEIRVVREILGCILELLFRKPLN